MTEDEAKQRWCPFARGEQHGGGNRAPYGSPGDGPVEDDYTSEMAMRYPCIGSACMAWRWLGHRDRANHKTVERFTDIAEGATDQDLEAVGFCGLASRP